MPDYPWDSIPYLNIDGSGERMMNEFMDSFGRMSFELPQKREKAKELSEQEKMFNICVGYLLSKGSEVLVLNPADFMFEFNFPNGYMGYRLQVQEQKIILEYWSLTRDQWVLYGESSYDWWKVQMSNGWFFGIYTETDYPILVASPYDQNPPTIGSGNGNS